MVPMFLEEDARTGLTASVWQGDRPDRPVDRLP